MSNIPFSLLLVILSNRFFNHIRYTERMLTILYGKTEVRRTDSNVGAGAGAGATNEIINKIEPTLSSYAFQMDRTCFSLRQCPLNI